MWCKPCGAIYVVQAMLWQLCVASYVEEEEEEEEDGEGNDISNRRGGEEGWDGMMEGEIETEE